MKSAMLSAAGVAYAGQARAQDEAPTCPPARSAAWRRGIENQRVADLGDGRFLNPVLAGNYADPTVLKDGEEYYMTHSSYDANPGVLLWRSRDLVNWTPMQAILTQPIGTVWAMDLIKHRGRYYLYIPATPNGRQTILVMHAPRITGPWSDPIDLGIGAIDPGHCVGEDGKRYLFTNAGGRVRLSDDGLSTASEFTNGAYELWRYPNDWDVEMYAPEGPKFFWRNGYLYLVAAVGGTSGPPTSHMVVVSRSRSVFGPWEQCPHNPIVRSASVAEPWWSRGHATLLEGPGGDWWMLYHGYENGYRTLGRQVLLDPVIWDDDGWPHAQGGDLSNPIPKPRDRRGREISSGLGAMAFSDDFSTNKFGRQWRFFKPTAQEMARVSYENASLVLRAKGASPADCSPMNFTPGDHAYEVNVTLEDIADAQGGLMLFYNEKSYYGLGFDGRQLFTYAGGIEQGWIRVDVPASRLRLKLKNDRHVITMHYAADGGEWIKHSWQFEVSGVHHNVFGEFLSLAPSLFACGAGSVRYRDFQYRALE